MFTAWVQSLPGVEQAPIASRAIIVEKIDAWRDMVDSGQRLILVCAERLEMNEELIAEARRKGHHVLVPISSIRPQTREPIRLDRMNRHDLEQVLRSAGLSEQDAYSLARHSGGSFSVLRRRFSSVALISVPKWAQGLDAEQLAPLVLAGAWHDGNPSDQAAIGKLSQQAYPEARGVVSRWRAQADAPCRWAEGVWEFVSLLDAWNFLQAALSPAQLDRWEEVAREVLGVDDPRLELPPEQRWQAKVYGKQFAYSDELRQGLAQTLALLGTRELNSQVADTTPLQTRANRVVRAILPEGAAWQRWASVGRLLPLVAEAAPDAFLESVEAGLRGDIPELPKLFAQESSGITGTPEYTGLLWALEGLAWPPHLLARVSIVLARLAELDPGGSWANRPRASLRDIFFSGMPHTTASLEQRLEVIELLLQRHPTVGWNLVLDLLPHGSDVIMHHRPPEWRFWAENWQRGVTVAAYSRTVRALTRLAVFKASESPAKWPDLIEGFAQWPRAEMEYAVEALEGVRATALEDTLRRQLWNSLLKQTRQHRYFSDAQWALPENMIARLEAVRDKFQPEDAVELAVPLFKPGFEIVGHNTLPWEQQEELRLRRRMEAVRAVLAGGGLPGVVRLARSVESPWDVGITLASLAGGEYDVQILPSLLGSSEKSVEQFSGAYAAHRIHHAGRDWAEGLPTPEWSDPEAAAFTANMPFSSHTWDFVATLGESVDREYWRRTFNYAPGLSSADVERAVRKLVAVGRPAAAIDLLAMAARQHGGVPPSTVLELVEAALTTAPEKVDRPVHVHQLEALLQELQRSPEVDETRMARLEWALLPQLGSHTFSSTTLHKILARDPGFFVEVLSSLYQRHGSSDTETIPGDESPLDEAVKQRAQAAWHLLNGWHRTPGMTEDGTIDPEQLNEWVRSARERATAADRLVVCDITLGGVLAYSPPAPDGTWPAVPVRDILDATDSPKLRSGFVTGIFNKRGVYSKSLDEGGREERELASEYERYAKACETRWPHTGAALMKVAAGYLAQARHEDEEAEGRK